MDTVSYLTINDETKEIADLDSRNNIENIATTLAAQGDSISYLQSNDISLARSLGQVRSMARSAQLNIESVADVAGAAWNQAESATQAANVAWDKAESATTAANIAWEMADSATTAANVAWNQAESATTAANVAWNQAESATTAADNAWDKANEASEAAALADYKADLASAAADAAQYDARRANNYANGALAGLGTLESVIDTVNWFADHKVLSIDTEVDLKKDYYSYDSITKTLSKIEPVGDENPSEEGWYEIDETIKNYIVSHVAQTDDGLYLSSISTNWRILVSTGAGNYAPGIFIVDPNGIIKQQITGDGITFDNTSQYYLGDPTDEQAPYLLFDGRNRELHIGGKGVNIHSGVTIGQDEKSLAEVLNDLGRTITTIEYGSSNSPIDHSSVEEWSTTTPAWQPNKYIWMRTTTNGATYTYSCIQGAQQGPMGLQGPQGEKGEKGENGEDGIGILSVEVFYAITNSDEIFPEDDEWKDSLSQWFRVNETGTTGEIGETGTTGEIDVIGETGETGEINKNILPLLPQGVWLWVKTETTYTDYTSSVTYQKSYIGSDGADGNSIYIQNSSKENGVTTITLIDGEGNLETIQIADGEDGANGVPGANGKSIHIAWADQITLIDNDNDPSTPATVQAIGFSTSESTNKKYIGVYSDTEINDNNDPNDYSWSLIKGSDGYNNARILLYKRAAAQPSPPSVTLTYTFSTSDLTGGSLAGWSRDIPSGSNPCWVIAATATNTGASDNITSGEWTTPVKVFEDGAAGLNQATIFLYQRATNQPSKPANTLTYNFSTGNLTGTLGNWTREIPTANGYPCWITTAVAISSDASDDILTTEWSTPVQSFADGADGKILNILPGIYTLQQLPNINLVEDGDAYLVDDGDGQYDLYYKGSGATTWTIVEDWQGVPGPRGETGAAGSSGPEAVVTVEPTNINWDTKIATLSAILRINGEIVTPTTYNWTKNDSSISLGQNSTVTVNDLNASYHCTVTW